MEGEVHSTRLFPKNRGAEAYRITGIASRCDWVVLSDARPPETVLVRRRPGLPPRHVFLSLRSPHRALEFFMAEVLPQLTAPFVLISGSEDITLPRQTDLRFRGFDPAMRSAIGRLAANPLLSRWFVENLDDPSIPKMEPMPVGMVFPQGPPEGPLRLPDTSPLGNRPLRVLCAHRERPGPQWDLRRKVTALARGFWAGWTTTPEAEMAEPAYMRLVERHSFVLCVEGGGIDPSPKAWQALIHGAIPIIRSHSLRAAYAGLPVVILEDWEARHITEERLAAWRDCHAPAFATPAARERLRICLTLDHWWSRVLAAGSRDRS